MEKAEDLFLEDETTKKTERVRFAKGSTEQAEVPPPPDEGSPAEDEIPPPAIESVEEPPAAAQQAEAEVAEEDLPEAEIVPDGTPAEALTQRDGAPLQERAPGAARPRTGGPAPRKAGGGRGGLLFKALLIGVIFGGVVISALHFFPKWFGPGNEEEISTDPQEVGSTPVDAGTAATDGGPDPAPPADQPGPAGEPAADAPGLDSPERADDQDEGQQEPEGEMPSPQAFEVTPEIKKIRAQGRRLFKRKKYRKAARFLEKKLQDHPGDPVLHYLAGLGLFRLHKVGESIEELERAVELDPAFADAHFELGGVYLKAKKRDKACQAMKRFVELESGTKRSRGVEGNIRLLKCR